MVIKPTLLIVSQVYVPDPTAVGQHIAELAELMAARGYRVIVYTSRRGYEHPSQSYVPREFRRGVDVRRLPLSSFGKSSIAIRLLAQVLFVAQAIMRGIFIRNLQVVLVSTSPPFAGFAGYVLSCFRKVRLVWWVMDLNPDQLVAAGLIDSRALIVRVFDWANRQTMHRAECVVALDRFMKQRLLTKADIANKLRIIPPWPHQTSLAPQHGSTRGASFRQQLGLGDKFVVMYSGNHSPQNPLDTLLEAASRLADNDRIRFLFVGGGAGKAAIDHRVAEGARNIISLPYQPFEILEESLSTADIHVVSIGESMVGIIHPCKIYSAMALGKPIVLFSPSQSHAVDILEMDRVGWHVQHGDIDRTCEVITDAAALSQLEIEEIGTNAARLSDAHFSKELLLNALCDCLDGGLKNAGSRSV